MAKYPKAKPLTIAQQKGGLLFTYRDLVTNMSKDRNIVDCRIRLQPTLQSKEYLVRIIYKGYGRPKAWLYEPDLELYEGKKPHHIYGEDEKGHPELCVYEPEQDKWSTQKSLARVFVPWVITWLYAYEIWLVTGLWLYPEATVLKTNKE